MDNILIDGHVCQGYHRVPSGDRYTNYAGE